MVKEANTETARPAPALPPLPDLDTPTTPPPNGEQTETISTPHSQTTAEHVPAPTPDCRDQKLRQLRLQRRNRFKSDPTTRATRQRNETLWAETAPQPSDLRTPTTPALNETLWAEPAQIPSDVDTPSNLNLSEETRAEPEAPTTSPPCSRELKMRQLRQNRRGRFRRKPAPPPEHRRSAVQHAHHRQQYQHA